MVTRPVCAGGNERREQRVGDDRRDAGRREADQEDRAEPARAPKASGANIATAQHHSDLVDRNRETPRLPAHSEERPRANGASMYAAAEKKR